MTLTETITAATAAPPAPAAPPGGVQSWKWQLRDKNGRWIQMGSEVSFSHQGKTITGVIIGSPGPGKATVRLANGTTMTVATAGVTATGKKAPGAPGAPAAPGTPAAPKAGTPAAPAEKKQVKAVAPKLKTAGKATPSGGSTRKAAAPSGGTSGSRSTSGGTSSDTGSTTKRKARRSSSSSSGGGSEGREAPDDKRLMGTHRTSQSIEGLLRIRAKELGRKDPFGEQESKSEKGGSKDGKKSESESESESGSSSGGGGASTTRKKRKDNRKPLTQGQIDAVNVIMKAVLKHVKAGEYSTALGRLKNAKAILKDTSAPWLNKRIAFLTKGLKGVQGITSSAAMAPQAWAEAVVAALRSPFRLPLIAAAGDSWTWQLRDREGQWIQMGSRVSWLLGGMLETGSLIGSPRAGKATVRDERTGRTTTLDADWLTVLPEDDSLPESVVTTLQAEISERHVESLRAQAADDRRHVSRYSAPVTGLRASARLAEIYRESAERLEREADGHDPLTCEDCREGLEEELDFYRQRTARKTLTAAAGESWRWQLRDQDGQWINMGGRVKWFLGGKYRTGQIVGSPDPDTAIVRSEQDGKDYSVSSSEITALPKVGSMIRQISGAKNAKAVIGEVVGRPKKGWITVRTIGGKEKDVTEKNATILPLTQMQENVLRFGGLSTKIDGTQPTTGYMAAQTRGGAVGSDGLPGIPEADFFGPDGKRLVIDFMRANAKQFDSDPNVYLGLWHDKAAGRVTIDVSHNVPDRESAILFGQYQDQRKVWDVVNEEEIDTGGTGGYADLRPADEEDRGDVGRRTGGVGGTGDQLRPPPRIPPPTGERRPAAVLTSMGAVDPTAYGFINNGGGTLADPVHVYPYAATEETVNKKGVSPATPARTLTVRQSEVAKHLRDTIEIALRSGEKPAIIKASEEQIAEAHVWYQTAQDECLRIQALFNGPDFNANLPLETVAGVMAAISPRVTWPQNIVNTERVIAAYLSNTTRSLDDLRGETAGGLHDNVAIALKILDGDPAAMSGIKRKSFWNNIMNPKGDYDVTIDGWMAAAIWRMGGTYSDGTPVDEKALSWIDHGAVINGERTDGAGYILMADAVRDVARDLGLLPSQAQAIYWTAVGGGQQDTQMWSNEPKRATPVAGYNSKGKPTWTQVQEIKNYPFSRWIIGNTEFGPDARNELSPFTDRRWHRYGHFQISDGMTKEGKMWLVTDPAEIGPRGAALSVPFKTKKAAQAYMDAKYPEGPPPRKPASEPGAGEGYEKVMAAIKRLPPEHPLAFKASGEPPDSLTLDADGGEWTPPNTYDAVAIRDMATTFRQIEGVVDPFLSAWEMTGPHPTAGQIIWCWENPDAWDLLAGEVDKEWFAEQVATRVPLATQL